MQIIEGQLLDGPTAEKRRQQELTLKLQAQVREQKLQKQVADLQEQLAESIKVSPRRVYVFFRRGFGL